MEASAPQVTAPGRSPLLLPWFLYCLSSSPPKPTHSHVHAHTYTHAHTRAHALLSLLAQVACSLPIPAGSRSSLCARVLRGGLCPHLVPLGCGGDACCAFPEGLEFKLSLKQGWEGWKTGWGLRQVRATVCSAPKILCDLSSFSRKQ